MEQTIFEDEFSLGKLFADPVVKAHPAVASRKRPPQGAALWFVEGRQCTSLLEGRVRERGEWRMIESAEGRSQNSAFRWAVVFGSK